MRIFSKDGKQVGVQDDKTKHDFFFDKADNLNPPKSIYYAMESKKPVKKVDKK